MQLSLLTYHDPRRAVADAAGRQRCPALRQRFREARLRSAVRGGSGMPREATLLDVARWCSCAWHREKRA